MSTKKKVHKASHKLLEKDQIEKDQTVRRSARLREKEKRKEKGEEEKSEKKTMKENEENENEEEEKNKNQNKGKGAGKIGISNVDEKMGEKIITEQNSHPISPKTTDNISELQNLEQQGHNIQSLILNELSPQHSVTSTPNIPILQSSSTGVSLDSSSAINLNLSNTTAPSSQSLQNTSSPLEKHYVSELKKLKRKIDDDDINSDHESKRVRAFIAALMSQLTPNYGVECDAAMIVGEKA
ncbi:hypothetical protein K3495_g16469, partial [Podosphaera aphanis]